ncbi:MAG TPA: hypothetical protein VJI75_05480 [Candidatus Nanoarchaeia archaeon]|nr:hypothetical protein [Candidatus Nanoarchaeia archaeon]
MLQRKPNLFEKMLLIVGVIVLMAGYGLIHRQVTLEGFNIDTIQSIFLWFILVALIIIAAVTENVKEELRQLIELHLEEIRALRSELRKK